MTNLGVITDDLDLEAAGADLVGITPRDITEDSRAVRPGSIFIARPGTRTDGRRFIPQAIQAGAIAILTDHSVTPETIDLARFPGVAFLRARDLTTTAAGLAERFFGNPSAGMTLVGVTGTNGKTTVTHLIRHGLASVGHACGLIGTVAIDDGIESTPASLTTPSAIDVSRALARMRDRGRTTAVLEVSSHALHQGRVAALDFDIAVFTNLTGDHLDYHLTLGNYADAKAILFERLRDTAAAIVNADDPAHKRTLRDCRAPALCCAAAPRPADYTIAPLGSSLDGTRARVTTPARTLDLDSPLVGAHNLMNLLQAVAVLDRLGIPLDDIRDSLSTIPAPPGRLEPVRPDHLDVPFTVLVDYAHTDDALDSVLRAVRPFVHGALRLVFGCGGDRDRSKRPRMAAAACRHADSITITSDNPRTEDPLAIIDDALAGVARADRPRVHVEPDRASAIRHAIDAAGPGDLVLIAGKGHEDYQLLPDQRGGIVRRDFDDRLVAADALRQRATNTEHAACSRARTSP